MVLWNFKFRFFTEASVRGVECIGGGSEDILVCVVLYISQNTEKDLFNIFGKQ